MSNKADRCLADRVRQFFELDRSLPSLTAVLDDPERILASLEAYAHSRSLLDRIREEVATGIHQITNAAAKIGLLEIRKKKTRTDQYALLLHLLAYAASAPLPDECEQGPEERQSEEEFRAVFSTSI